MSQFIRRHPIASFFVWFFTVGQLLAFTPLLIGDALGPAQLFICASTLVGLLLPALVITRIVDGPGAVRALLARAVALRAGLGWYLLALVGVPLVAAVITVLVAGPPSRFPVGALVPHLLLPLVLTLLPNNLWEEVAWTGFVQARLQERRGPLVAALLTGPMFALQHVSGVVSNGPVGAAVLLVGLVVLVTPFRFLTGWVYNRTGSLFLVGLVHGAGNAVAGGSGFGTGLLAHLYPGQTVATMAHLVAFFLVGLVVVVVTRGRLGIRTSGRASPAPAPRSAPASRGSRTPRAAAAPGTAGSPASRKPLVNSTNVGGRVLAWVANRTLGCLPPRTGGGVAAITSDSQPLSRPVGIRRSQDSSAVRSAGAILATDRPVSAETLIRSAHCTRTRSRSSSRFMASRRSSSTRSHLLNTSTSARPASSTMVISRWSCSAIGSLASISTMTTSAASIAAWVRRLA